MGIGDWGLGIGPNPQSPIPNPQSPIPIPINYMNIIYINFYFFKKFQFFFIINDSFKFIFQISNKQ